MEDLRQEVAVRLRNALHGREIDMVEQVKPHLPHMLGITPINSVHDPTDEDMTLLDPNHHFWNNYEEEVRTKNAVTEKIQTAIHSLREDGIFQMTYPYGEEAEVVYCEVEYPTTQNNSAEIETTCTECNREITTEPNLLEESGSYYLTFSLDCHNCDFSRTLEQPLRRL